MYIFNQYQHYQVSAQSSMYWRGEDNSHFIIRFCKVVLDPTQNSQEFLRLGSELLLASYLTV
jgi:hypothetical protein